MTIYALYDSDAGRLTAVNIIEEENGSYTARLGDINYTLQDIAAPIGVVLDANNQQVFVIDWDVETIHSTAGLNLAPIEWDNTNDEDDEDEDQDIPSWDDEPAPVPGHYGPAPEPDNLPNPNTLFHNQEPDDGPTLDDQLIEYDPTTDIGRAIFYGEVYEVHECSSFFPTPSIVTVMPNGTRVCVGWVQDHIPHFF